jgi:hypothetical protein
MAQLETTQPTEISCIVHVNKLRVNGPLEFSLIVMYKLH